MKLEPGGVGRQHSPIRQNMLSLFELIRFMLRTGSGLLMSVTGLFLRGDLIRDCDEPCVARV